MSTEDRVDNKNKIEIEGNEEEISDEFQASSEQTEEADINEEENELEELNQKYLRLAADFDNYKRRMAKEKADSIAYGNEELIREFLNVLDNLERALEHTQHKDDVKPIIDGVKLVQKQFMGTLEKFGVQGIDSSEGIEFDPMLHQAVDHAESDDVEPGLVLSEMLPGYTLKDRLLRPALVVVSKNKEDSSKE